MRKINLYNKKRGGRFLIKDAETISKTMTMYRSLGSLFPFTQKERFLLALKGKNKKYKRYLGSPLRYAGGKSWAVGYIVEYLPENIKRLVSPFFGGGSFEIAVAKELGIPVLGFEIFDILVNYWEFQITYYYV